MTLNWFGPGRAAGVIASLYGCIQHTPAARPFRMTSATSPTWPRSSTSSRPSRRYRPGRSNAISYLPAPERYRPPPRQFRGRRNARRPRWPCAGRPGVRSALWSLPSPAAAKRPRRGSAPSESGSVAGCAPARSAMRRLGRMSGRPFPAPGGYPVRWTRDLEFDSQNPLGFGVEKNEVPGLIAHRHSNGQVCQNRFQNLDFLQRLPVEGRAGHKVFAFSEPGIPTRRQPCRAAARRWEPGNP